MTSGIYKITNKGNGKVYVGCSKHIERRWKEHINGSGGRYNLIHHSILKYGLDNFSFHIILECPNICFDYWEKHYIKENNCVVPNGYNLNHGGLYNVVVSDKTKTKMSRSHKKMIGNLNSFFGKVHSIETKNKISLSKKGKSTKQNKKRVQFEGVIYECVFDLMSFLGMSKTNFYRNIKKRKISLIYL